MTDGMTCEKAIDWLKLDIKMTMFDPMTGEYKQPNWEALQVIKAQEKAIEALEKQIPKKPIYSDYDDNGFDEIIPNEAKCPVCGYEFEFGMWNEFDNPYCYCGQAIDWS